MRRRINHVIDKASWEVYLTYEKIAGVFAGHSREGGNPVAAAKMDARLQSSGMTVKHNE